MSEAFQEAMKEGRVLETKDFNEKHLEDFKKSGLKIETVKKAGYRAVDDGYEIPITNPLTKEVYYYRKKLDKSIKIKDGKGKEKEIRYLSPPGSEPRPYFSLQIDDWNKILSDPKIPIVLTEGEKKADKYIQDISKSAVAISGVWCWLKDGIPINDLRMLCQGGRAILPIFDADYKDKPQVQEALSRLKQTVKSYGGIPIDCSLPGPEKGLDDFLVARGKEALDQHILKCLESFLQGYKKEQYYLQQALEYLSGDVIRDNFLPKLKRCGLTGEKTTAVACYISANSRCSKDINGAIHITQLGHSGVGKSVIFETILENFTTDKYFLERSGFTAASIYRRGAEYFKHKCILLSEFTYLEQGQEDISALLRQLKTRGKAEREVVKKKGKDDFEPITLRAEGPTAFIRPTTSFAGKDEDKNRDIFISPDESIEQTKDITVARIKRNQKYDPKTNEWKKENLKIQEKVQDILVKFIPAFIEIPYSDRISYPEKGESARRDGNKIDQTIHAICHTNILNRKFKLLGTKPIIDEIKRFIENYNFGSSDLAPVVLIQNLKLSLDIDKNIRIEDQNNCVPEINDSIDRNTSECEVIIGIEGEGDVVIDSPDPILNYKILEEFVFYRDYKFVLISDKRDFSLLKEYFASSIEAPYNELEPNLMKYYRQFISEGKSTDNYEFTAQRAANLTDKSDTWMLKILKQLSDKDFAELINPNKKPEKFKIKIDKLAKSFDSDNSEDNSKRYTLNLKDISEFPDVSCFDLEYCRIKRQFLVKAQNRIKTTGLESEVPKTSNGTSAKNKHQSMKDWFEKELK